MYTILIEVKPIDYWNQFTRLYYVITVNNRTLDPGQVNTTLLIDSIRFNIENIKRNLFQTYLLCGITNASMNATLTSTQNIRFPFAFDVAANTFTLSTLASIIRKGIQDLTANTVRFNIEINFSDSYKSVGVLSNFNKNLGPNNPQISSSSL